MTGDDTMDADIVDANERLGTALVRIGLAAGLPAGTGAGKIRAEVERLRNDRTCTRCGDGDLYPRRCSQCGQRWADMACGPTHASITEELGIGDLRRELAESREGGQS